MPREYVYHDYPIDPDTRGSAAFVAVVSWRKDGDLTVGVEARDQRHFVDAIYADRAEAIGGQIIEWANGMVERGQKVGAPWTDPTDQVGGWQVTAEDAAGVGRMVLDVLTGCATAGPGLHADLSRRQSNQLVRLVQKGRNAAYEADA